MNRPCLLCMRLRCDAHVADAEHVPSEGSQKHASVTERAATRMGTSDSAARSVAGTTEHSAKVSSHGSRRWCRRVQRLTLRVVPARWAHRASPRARPFAPRAFEGHRLARPAETTQPPRWDAAPRLEFLKGASCRLSKSGAKTRGWISAPQRHCIRRARGQVTSNTDNEPRPRATLAARATG